MKHHSILRKLIRARIIRCMTNLKQTPHSRKRKSIVKKERQSLTQTEGRTVLFDIIRQSQDRSHAETKKQLHLGKKSTSSEVSDFLSIKKTPSDADDIW